VEEGGEGLLEKLAGATDARVLGFAGGGFEVC
jgi:hypothetical protein